MKTINNESKKAWAEYLGSIRWNYFATFSTPYELTDKSARRTINRFHETIKSCNLPCIIFFATEPFDLKEGYHLHCLIKIEGDSISKYMQKKIIAETWNKVTGTSKIEGKGSRVHLENYIKKLGGNNYVAKYINRPNADYDLIINKPL